MNRILSVFAVLLLSIAGAWADDYDPQNPPDPYISFKLTVSASPSEAGYVSGGGRYKEGQQVQLSTSPKANYDFLYWTCDGVQVSDQASFSYTMPQKPVNLVAVYAFNPTKPQEPTPATSSYRLYLESNMAGSCTFNITSGAKQNANQYITVSAQNVSQGFTFLGWYEGENKVSKSLSFQYLMPASNVTLTARFEYDPTNPDDPPTSQTDIDNSVATKGDVDGDGDVTAQDASLVLQLVAGKITPSTAGVAYGAADVDGDGDVTAQDASLILQHVAGKITIGN